ncbi:hypothetical protein [Rhodohalobacter sulfatireducens]|uniref:Uncharacterized protein n=1 Tax=Rhodohalobacter sulfatireducens TaxID=2911366 RepID=A0ABS9KF62_9BACT|nr:hypothetical protein [Rhodohalobacter sulfatireducens]MCG2589455.1 hypothetical protein [Rhodohalobacter sulfatireducens]
MPLSFSQLNNVIMEGAAFLSTNRLTFSNISKDGFDWAGDWVNKDESILYPFWRIYCTKEEGEYSSLGRRSS